MKFSDKELKVCVLFFLIFFLMSGCSHLSPILIVNYMDEDVKVDLGGEFTVPKHSHVLAKTYLGGASGVFLKITSGKKTLVDRVLTREEMNRNMVSDDLLLWEVR